METVNRERSERDVVPPGLVSGHRLAHQGLKSLAIRLGPFGTNGNRLPYHALRSLCRIFHVVIDTRHRFMKRLPRRGSVV